MADPGGTVLTPGGTDSWNLQVWQRTIEPATYQRMQFIPTIDQGPRPYDILNIRKHGRASSTTLGQSAEGHTLTASDITATTVTVSAAGNYVMVAWSANEEAQTEVNLDAEARGNIEQALAESTDESALTNVASLTQTMSQASVDLSMYRKALGRLMGNTNGMFAPGETPNIYGIFTHKQYPSLMDIPELTNAEVRGDSENPQVKGIWARGSGTTLKMSTVIENDANGDHNCLYVPSAFVVAWNVRSMIKNQEEELMSRVIVFNNLGTNVKHDLRAIDLRTTASAL
jgi:hypothetical protein